MTYNNNYFVLFFGLDDEHISIKSLIFKIANHDEHLSIKCLIFKIINHCKTSPETRFKYQLNGIYISSVKT